MYYDYHDNYDNDKEDDNDGDSVQSLDRLGRPGGQEGQFSRDPLPVILAGGPCEQFWHVQGCPLFDVVHSAFCSADHGVAHPPRVC